MLRRIVVAAAAMVKAAAVSLIVRVIPNKKRVTPENLMLTVSRRGTTS
jgi:hypothetical protein